MPSSVAILLITFAIFGPPVIIAGISTSLNNPPAKDSRLPTIYYLKYILANYLQLGESCSWRDETFRQAGYRKMYQFPKNSPQYNQVFDSMVSNTVQKGRTFCRALDMLLCDKTTARCVCGEQDVQDTLGNRYKPTDYVTELDAETGKKVCRYNRETPCIPEPVTITAGDAFTFKCAQGLSCNYGKDGTTCTKASQMKHALDSIRRNETYEDYLDGIMTGKMCKCENEVTGDDTNTNWNGRQKRSLNEDDEAYARAKSELFRRD